MTTTAHLQIDERIRSRMTRRALLVDGGAVAHIHVTLASLDNRLAVILSDVDNAGPSITNCCESVANQVWLELFARCAVRPRDYPVWIEHYPGTAGGHPVADAERLAVIEFSVHTPVYGGPAWRAIGLDSLVFDREQLRSDRCGQRVNMPPAVPRSLRDGAGPTAP